MTERHTIDSITSDALDQLYDELDAAQDRLASLDRTTLPNLHHRIESDAKTIHRWRDRAEGAEAARDRLLRSRDRQAARAKTAAARVTELETEVVRLRTTPAEHCGNQKPPFSEHTQRTECVLRPHHHGSHADEHGTRWWRIDDRPTTA